MPINKISIHDIDLESRKNLFAKRCPSEYKKAFEFLRLSSLGEINKGKRVTEATQRKYLDFLSTFCPNVNKPINNLTKKDMQNFIENLQNNRIVKHNEEPYSDPTKRDVKVFLKTYLKWRLPKRYVEFTDWFDTKLKKSSPEILRESEAEKLYKSCKNSAERFLICCLFDGGFRIEEFLNIRFEDIEEPKESFPYYKINIRDEFSKTSGRNVGMYWKYSTETIREYLNSCDKSKYTAPVYPKTYDAVRIFLTRAGRRILNRRVHAHLFRKSSATFYASKLNRQQLCIRYGWGFSSEMVDVYIKRSGVSEDDIKEKMLTTDIGKLEKENKELNTKIAILGEQMQEIAKLMKLADNKMKNQ